MWGTVKREDRAINTHQVPECLIKTLDNDKYCWLGQTVGLMTDTDTCYLGLCESDTQTETELFKLSARLR